MGNEADEAKSPIEMIRADESTVYRYFRASKEDFEDENTFQVKMSSEFPAEQRATKEHERLGIARAGEKFIEVLSHDDGDVDLTRFVGENRAPLLDEHIDSRHIGYIKTAALSKEDKATRGVVVYDNLTKLSKTRAAQCRNNSRPNFSIGYAHTRYLGKVALEDGKTGHRFAWQALELSNVAVPADPGAQKGRGKNTDVHCIRCGDIFGRKDLNDDFMCGDCEDAETPAEAARAIGVREFRSKKEGKEIRISHSELRQKTVRALDADKRFKHKRANGDAVADFYHHDTHQVSADGTEFQAVVSSPAWRDGSKLYAVDFNYDGDKVTLGDMTHVEPKQTLEAVDRGVPCDLKKFRSEFDSTKFTEEATRPPNILTRKNMADKTEAEIAAEALKNQPQLVIDSLDTPHVQRALKDKGYRTKVELDAAANEANTKLQARNTEILALETEFSRDFGSRIAYRKVNGKEEPLYVRDGIHIAAMEACAHDGSKSDSEVRQIFRSKVDDLKRDSIAEETIRRAVDAAEDGIAGRCADMFDTIKRTINENHKEGRRSTGLMPGGGELEYSDEMRRQFKSMPGCGHIADLPGFISPRSKGIKVQRNGRGQGRMGRDALASDFSTAGAFVAPEFRPYIELLRNRTVLDKLGCTYLGGCNGEQVFPRQDAATVAQSVAEGAQLNPYDQTLGQIKMTPHRVGSRQYYSRLAVIMAVPGWEAMVWDDHSKVLALYQDEMGINGTGAADQPVGILNQPGINQLVFGGTPTYQRILDFRTNIRKFNVTGDLAFTTTSVGQGRLAFLPAALNGSTVITQGELDAIWKGDEENGEMLGCRAVASQQIPNDILLAGVFSNLMLASWGGIFTTLDNYTRADRDEVAITFNTYFDIAVRHAQAFTRSLDSVNQ